MLYFCQIVNGSCVLSKEDCDMSVYGRDYEYQPGGLGWKSTKGYDNAVYRGTVNKDRIYFSSSRTTVLGSAGVDYIWNWAPIRSTTLSTARRAMIFFALNTRKILRCMAARGMTRFKLVAV